MVAPILENMQAAALAETTLRTQIDAYRAAGRPLDLAHAIGIVVPLAVELADQHRAGYAFYLYPSALFYGQDERYHASSGSATPPTDPRDLACLPPEAKGVDPGTGHASVYGIAALLYELITLESVGPGMKRPSDLAAGVPPELELILSKALVADPAHRPDDLNALAQALYQINTTHTAPPPPADLSHLDHNEDGFDVDVSLSMLPPAPKMTLGQPTPSLAQQDAPLPPGMSAGTAPTSGRRPTGGAEDLMAVKARLEADRRPRFVVVKEGMDHGPFSAVELLQQIASHTFEENDVVRDSADGTSWSIVESADFGPFARHARMHRAERAEKVAIQQAVVAESRSTRGKTFLGVLVFGGILAAAGAWFLTVRGQKNDAIAVVEEQAANIEADTALVGPKKKGGGGARIVGSAGGFPQLGSGMSCEAAQNAYVEEMKMGVKGQADLSAGQFQAVLGNGAYLNSCGAPENMGVNVCAAIQNGRAVGVTVTTTPRNPGISGCIAGRVRGMSFPSHPKLDVTRTNF